MSVSLCTFVAALLSLGVSVLIPLFITVCLSVCLSVSWSVCLRLVVPSLSVYCYLYVFISVSLSLCLPVLPALQFRMFAYFPVPVFVCFPASGSARPRSQPRLWLFIVRRSWCAAGRGHFFSQRPSQGSLTAGGLAPRALQLHWCGGMTLVARRSCAELHTTSLPADSHSTTRITPNFPLSFCLSPSVFYLTTKYLAIH